jgi:pyruvate,water dikinase
MDTEWTLSNGKIYMLQARPITTASGIEDLNILGADDKIICQDKKVSLISERCTPLPK